MTHGPEGISEKRYNNCLFEVIRFVNENFVEKIFTPDFIHLRFSNNARTFKYTHFNFKYILLFHFIGVILPFELISNMLRKSSNF